MRRLTLLLIAFVASLPALDVGAADKKSDAARSKKADAASSASDGEAKSSDKQVMAFVEEHHAELAMLLNRLRKQSSSEYRKAVADIRVIQERVDRMSERQPARADYEIDRWKIDSRIRLLTARMISLMEDSTEGVEHPDLAAARDELRDLSRERVQLDRDRLEREKKLLLSRLEKLQEQTARIDDDFEAAVDRQMAVLSRGVEAAAKKRGVAAKRRANKIPAASKSNDEKTRNK